MNTRPFTAAALRALRLALTMVGVAAGFGAAAATAAGAEGLPAAWEGEFGTVVRPFLQKYCVECHGPDKPEAELDLAAYSSTVAVKHDDRHWSVVLERLAADEMPPKKAKAHPDAAARGRVVAWFQALRDDELRRHAGDPGIVLARRLSNAEYNYTIRDLTGVDLQPTREFPVDPANPAGFDNSGESLAMSPALLNKYLQAARDVANHLVLKPDGFDFAAQTMLAETDRDRYCVQRIIQFYHRQNTQYADYFQAAWWYAHRAELGRPQASLAEVAADRAVSPTYLALVWSRLAETKIEVGPLVKLQALWRELPAPVAGNPTVARAGCEAMRDFVVQFRKKVEPRFWNLVSGKVGSAAQPFLIWKNVQYATHRMSFDPAQLQVAGEPPPPPPPDPEPGAGNEFGPGKTRPVKNVPGDADLVVPAGERARYEAAFADFCRVFPDRFYMEERGRNYFDTSKDRGRYLNAGYHSLMGYFRDDAPLSALVLDAAGQKELDGLWAELDFIASATSRMYMEFYCSGERQRLGQGESDPAEAHPPDQATLTSPRIHELEAAFLRVAGDTNPPALAAIREYFTGIDTTLRAVERMHRDAEPRHLAALERFAARAYRRPLTAEERADLTAFYRTARERDGLDHEAAMRESVVGVLLSPDLTYRIDLVGNRPGVQPLSDYDLASRLSYFLWSSLPDDALLARAAAGDLHQPAVIAAEARRMLQDPRARALAVEFGGNWLDFRRFEELNTVDRERFTNFTPGLRAAMFEEPVRLLLDVARHDRPVLDLLYARDTFVNPALARHYGIPVPAGWGSNDWWRVADADTYGRGGLLPMAVFLTKNAPGLRTSPVKRGNWVVKNILGEHIPAPPPNVPELPKDEAKLDLPLRELLARHREDPNCAACHARFDSLGLVFEGYGPTGERRERDLAGHPVETAAAFPGGGEGAGLAGLRQYLHQRREKDFVDNLCGKLLACALGRSLLFSDATTIHDLHQRLAANGYRFAGLVEGIVTSPQFLNKRGREELAER